MLTTLKAFFSPTAVVATVLFSCRSDSVWKTGLRERLASNTQRIPGSMLRAPGRYLCLTLAACAFWLTACGPHSSDAAAAPRTESSGEDPQRGQELFQRRCTSCHALDKEKEGPRLRGVFGRKSGSIPTFTYSDAMKNSNIVWNADLLNQWLTDTDRFMPDNNMNLSFKKADERADIIAYLKQLSNQ